MIPYIKNLRTGATFRASMRRLTALDEAEYLAAHSASGAEAKDCPPARAEDYRASLRRGEVWGVWAGEALAGAFSLLAPEHALGLSARLREECRGAAVSGLDRLFISPDFRAGGLGSQLCRAALDRAYRLGSDSVAAAVWPLNLPGVLAPLSCGFYICCARLDCGGLRYIMCAKRRDQRVFTDFERFPIEDVYGVTRMLSRRFTAISAFRDGGGHWLWLAK